MRTDTDAGSQIVRVLVVDDDEDDYLAGPDGLTPLTPSLFDGLNIVKLNLFDLNGTTVWSSDPKTIGITKRESPLS